MCNFVLVPPVDYPAILLNLVPTFRESRDYQSLDEEERSVAGFVFAEFSRFFESSLQSRDVVDECVQAIEHFALSEDNEAENLLITEVFENFQNPGMVRSLLLPASKLLYDKWLI